MLEMRGKQKGLLVFMLLVAVFSCLFLLHPRSTNADINPWINFQGKLTNPDGTNVTDGTYSITFGIYTAASGGSAVWSETQSSVSVSSGIFQVNLGSVTALPGSVNFNTPGLYLGVKVGSDPEMTPRIQFTAAPFAFNSQSLGGVLASGYGTLAGTQTWAGANTFSSSITANGGVSSTGLETLTYGSSTAASASTFTITNNNATGTATTVNAQAINLAGHASGTNTINGLDFGAISTIAGNTFNGLYFTDTNYNSVLNVAGTSIINGSGVLQSPGLNGSYSNGLTFSNTGNSFTGGSLTIGGTVSLNNNNNANTSINTGSSTGTVGIGNSAAGTITVQSGAAINVTANASSTISVGASNTLGVTSSNFNVTTAGRIFVPGTSGTNAQGYFTGTSTTPLGGFQSLDLGGNTYSFFGTNKYFNGTAWVDNGQGRVGSSFQIQNDNFTFYSFDTAANFTPRFTVASGGNVGIGLSGAPSALLSVGGSTGDLTVSTAGNVTTSGTATVNTTSATAFLVQTAGGATNLLTADTSALKVTINGAAQVTGAIQVGSIRIGTSATAGYFLTTDASGNGSWAAQTIQSLITGTGVAATTTVANGNIIWAGEVTTNGGATTLCLTTSGVCTGTAVFPNHVYSIQVTGVGGTTAINAPMGTVRSISADRRTLIITLQTGANVGLGGGNTTAFAANGTLAFVQVIGN
jgi:hypothetical protein